LIIRSDPPDMSLLVERLIKYAYPELRTRDFIILWRNINAIADITWAKWGGEVRIRLHPIVKSFNDPMLIGTFAHELSHVALKENNSDEWETDFDVVKRGLGPYLAIERASTGIYYDQPARGKSKPYMGFYTIMGLLSEDSKKNTERLAKLINLDIARELPLISTKSMPMSHDTLYQKFDNEYVLSIDGEEILLDAEYDENSDINIEIRNGEIVVFIDGKPAKIKKINHSSLQNI